MKRGVACLLIGLGAALAARPAFASAARIAPVESARWQTEANAVHIIRDTHGIAHVYGKSDADTVFGAMYAQAEDDFDRIERNYLTALGRLAEAEGESAVYIDLRQRLFVDPATLESLYRTAPPWLRELMTAWADGLNFYLATHPETKPKLIRHFEPWMALSFTEGSIGGDIESVDLKRLRDFYGGSEPNRTVRETAPGAPSRREASSGEVSPRDTSSGEASPGEASPGAASTGAASPGAAATREASPGAAATREASPAAAATREASPGGSNGFAIAPSRSASGHALLWINPHTSFYFRAELQMVSEQGLDTYGAATWGQFFIYQGFNSHNGWMHTSYGGDAIDDYAETIVQHAGTLSYRYGLDERPLIVKHIEIRYKDGASEHVRKFTAYFSHHGPIVRADGDRWIATKLLEDPVRALAQSYLRTKTTDYRSFLDIQDMRTDTSNNTVYADAEGTIAYFHGNFIPKRDATFDFTRPVDGSNPATEWHGPHAIADTITLLNPVNGWIQNTNNWPFSAAGEMSPKPESYPRYMWIKGENPRGIHAVEVLKNIHDVTLDSLIAAAYDGHLTAFDVLLPPLIGAYDRLAPQDDLRASLRDPIATLRGWNHRTSADSVATALAIFWGNVLIDRAGPAAHDADEPVYDFLVGHLSDADRLSALATATGILQRDFGRWQIPWGEINRFQRLTDDMVQPFDDAKPSLPVGFAPAQWGALASFDSAKPRTTQKIYGSVGNSFVAAVEFGSPVRAKAIMSGGESGDPASPHFTDQAAMFSRGEFRDVFFTPADVEAHAERRYHPGATQ